MAASLAHDYFLRADHARTVLTVHGNTATGAWGNDPAVSSVPSRRKCVKTDLRDAID
jgi:hypothetical protein